MIKSLKFIFIILGGLIIPERSSASSFKEIEEGVRKFKLGFEFQESNGLCNWARQEQRVQKKPVFSLNWLAEEEIELWHVVIDTNDIEFVTSPFECQNPTGLEKCMTTIQEAFYLLAAPLNDKEKITFNDWYTLLEERFSSPFTPKHQELFETLKQRKIKRPKDWKPIFSPQVTIQHHLEDTIFLYFGLLGFKTREVFFLKQALPSVDFFIDQLNGCHFGSLTAFFRLYQQKTINLIFLHALTLYRLALFGEDTEAQALETTLKNFPLEGRERETGATYQMDAKMYLNFMSRRPFSYLLKDAKIKTYEESFYKYMEYNTDFWEQTKSFPFVNYGVQFFSEDESGPKAINFLMDHLEEDFLNDHKEILGKLLAQGIITTPMLYHLKENPSLYGFGIKELFRNYFEDAIKSVENPSQKYIINQAYIFNQELAPIKKVEELEMDSLSPPYFLGNDDAMGRLRDPIDLRYGESVVEVRAIKSVGSFFLQRVFPREVIDTKTGYFLCKPESLLEDAVGLFNFLGSFNEERKNEVFFGMTRFF